MNTQKYAAILVLSISVNFFAMDNGMCPVSQLNASVPLSQGLSTVLVHFDHVYWGLAHAMAGTAAVPPKPIYSKKDTASRNNFLDQMAEREVCRRDAKARIIGQEIDGRYVGDSWANTIALYTGSSARLLATEDKVAALTDIHSAFGSTKWDTPLIESVRAESHHFDSLLRGLIIEKITDVPLLKGSNIDDFFNAYPNLPTPFRQYVQHKVEKEYRDVRMDGDQSKTVVFHVLERIFCQSYGEELKSLLQSSTYKKHELATDFAFACYVVKKYGPTDSWFSMACEEKDKMRAFMLRETEKNIQPEGKGSPC